MKFTYPDELSWLMQREQTKEDGFFVRDNKKYIVQYMSPDTLLEGYDVMLVDDMIVLVHWRRTQIASSVEEELWTKSNEQLIGFWDWLNDYIKEQAEECPMAIV